MSKIVGKKVPPKQVVDASDSESSESEPVVQKAVVTKKDKLQAKIQDKQATVAGVKAPAKKAPVPKSESEEEDTPPVVAKKVVPPPAKKTAPVPQVQKKAQESSSELESDSEPVVAPKKVVKAEPTKPIKKGSTELKKAPVTKGKPKQESSSESEEAKPVKKTTPVLQAKGKKAPVKPATSSESESEEPQKPVKGKNVTPAPQTKKVAPPAQDSDSDEDSEPPIVAKGKGTKAVSPKQAPKPSPKVAPKNSPKLGAVTKKPTKPAPKEESDSQQSEPVQKKVQAKQPLKGKKAPEPVSEEEEKPAVKQVGKSKAPAQKEEQKGEFEVYVGGLAWALAEGDIEAIFAHCGEVLAVRLLRKEDGKSKGIAFVKFSTESAREEAIKLNESEQAGRPIKVEKSNGKAENPNKGFNNNGNAANKGSFTNDKPIPDVIESSTIFVGNMSYASSPDSIKEFFADCGEIKDARIATDKESGRPRGFGYVEFYDTQSVRKALGKRGGELDGRFINIDVAAERKKDNYGGSGGYGGNSGGYGGNSGGYGGNSGGYGGNSYGNNRGAPRGGRGGFNNNRGANVALDDDDKNAKKGNMGTFKGTIKRLD